MKPYGACVVAIISSVVLAGATDLANYRGFRFGTTVEASLKQAGVTAPDVRVLHRRPALIQELEWNPGYTVRHDAKDLDPVRDHVLRFYNGQLFQVVSTYDRQKVEGMTEADLIEIIARTYGTATSPGGEISYRSNYGSVATVIARWEDSAHSADLVRSPDRVSFALVLTSKRLDASARRAIAEAMRLDELEAPVRAIEEKRKQDAAEKAELEKARSTNKPNFRP